MGTIKYDPKNVTVIYGDQIITGFADGDMVELEAKEDDWSLTSGADGTDVVAVRNRDDQASAKFTLFSGTPSAVALSGKAKTQRDGLTEPEALSVVDNNTGSSYFGAEAFIQKRPGKKYGKDTPTVEFSFLLPSMTMDEGSLL